MHPSHLTAFVDGFLTIGIPMQAKGATTREILIAMSAASGVVATPDPRVAPPDVR